MDYTEARKSIHTGDLLAWTHRGWKSFYDFQLQAVRIATESEYTHVGVAWVTSGRVFVLEAVSPCVRIYPLSLLGDFYHIPMKKSLSKEALTFALAQIGEPYSKLMAVKALFGLVSKGDSGEWQCAKYVAEIMQANGVVLDCGTTYTPSAIVQSALNSGKQLRFIKNK